MDKISAGGSGEWMGERNAPELVDVEMVFEIARVELHYSMPGLILHSNGIA